MPNFEKTVEKSGFFEQFYQVIQCFLENLAYPPR